MCSKILFALLIWLNFGFLLAQNKVKVCLKQDSQIFFGKKSTNLEKNGRSFKIKEIPLFLGRKFLEKSNKSRKN
jgi:hypothetical protein